MNNIYVDENDTPEVVQLTHEEYMEYKASCQNVIDLAEKAAKLSQDENFKAIVMDAYFDQEPKRLAGLMATGRLNDKQFDDCASDLKAIGSLRTFLQDFIQKGNIAKDEMANLEQAWNEQVTGEDE